MQPTPGGDPEHAHSSEDPGAFADLLNRAKLALPRVNPNEIPKEEISPEMELRQLAIIAIGKIWSMFQEARANSEGNPSMGYVDSHTLSFGRTRKSFSEEFRSYDSPLQAVGRMQGYMKQAFTSVFDIWCQANSYRREQDVERFGKFLMDPIQFRQMEELAADGYARQATSLSRYILGGFDTSLGSILAAIEILPEVFERDIGKPLTPEGHRDLINQVIHAHSQMAAGSFDFFVMFFSLAGQATAPFNPAFDPQHFRISEQDGKYLWGLHGDLAAVLRGAVSAQERLGNQSDGSRFLTGCLAYYSKSSAGEGPPKSVIKEFTGWIQDTLDGFYLPLFKQRGGSE